MFDIFIFIVEKVNLLEAAGKFYNLWWHFLFLSPAFLRAGLILCNFRRKRPNFLSNKIRDTSPLLCF